MFEKQSDEISAFIEKVFLGHPILKRIVWVTLFTGVIFSVAGHFYSLSQTALSKWETFENAGRDAAITLLGKQATERFVFTYSDGRDVAFVEAKQTSTFDRDNCALVVHIDYNETAMYSAKPQVIDQGDQTITFQLRKMERINVYPLSSDPFLNDLPLTNVTPNSFELILSGNAEDFARLADNRQAPEINKVDSSTGSMQLWIRAVNGPSEFVNSLQTVATSCDAGKIEVFNSSLPAGGLDRTEKKRREPNKT